MYISVGKLLAVGCVSGAVKVDEGEGVAGDCLVIYPLLVQA